MTVEQRLRAIRLSESVRVNPKIAQELGIIVKESLQREAEGLDKEKGVNDEEPQGN